MIGDEEKNSIIRLFAFINENPTVIDVGSNKGQFAGLILDEYKDKCKLHLFEPNEMLLNFTRIRFEYDFNVVYNREIAYRENNKDVPFFYFTNFNNELSSIYKDDEGWKELPMKERTEKTIRIDTYCDRNKIDYVDIIKIDCEGSDIDVLYGCEDLLNRNEVGFITVEYGGHYQRANKKFMEAFDLAEKYGYKIYRYEMDNYWEVKKDKFVEDYHYDNYIITKEKIHNYSIGWNNEFIKNTLELPKVEFALEVGCFEGLTTKYICENLLEPGGRIVCVDPLEDYYTKEDIEHKEIFEGQYQRFLSNTRGLFVDLIRKPSEVALLELHELRFPFIYIDGDHAENAVHRDGCNAFKICRRDGYILFDDYGWREGTKNGIDRFIRDHVGLIKILIQDYQVLIQKIVD